MLSVGGRGGGIIKPMVCCTLYKYHTLDGRVRPNFGVVLLSSKKRPIELITRVFLTPLGSIVITIILLLAHDWEDRASC